VSEIRIMPGPLANRPAVISALLPALAALLVFAGCGGNDDNKTTEASTSTAPSQTGNNHGTERIAGKPRAEVELDDFYFDPTVLKGSSGQTVTLELKNEGKVEHNFSLSEQNIDQDVEEDKSATVKVKLPASGTVRFFCKYHKAQNMAGSLSVSGSSSGSSSGGGSSGGDTTTQSSGGGAY
jgi:plastocyanin